MRPNHIQARLRFIRRILYLFRYSLRKLHIFKTEKNVHQKQNNKCQIIKPQKSYRKYNQHNKHLPCKHWCRYTMQLFSFLQMISREPYTFKLGFFILQNIYIFSIALHEENSLFLVTQLQWAFQKMPLTYTNGYLFISRPYYLEE